jgi:hypothetical protein
MSSVTLNLTVRGYGRAHRQMLGKREDGAHPALARSKRPKLGLTTGSERLTGGCREAGGLLAWLTRSGLSAWR